MPADRSLLARSPGIAAGRRVRGAKSPPQDFAEGLIAVAALVTLGRSGGETGPTAIDAKSATHMAGFCPDRVATGPEGDILTLRGKGTF